MGSSWAPAPSRSSSVAGYTRLRWRRALPSPSWGYKQHFSLLATTAGSCESPALSVASFRCSWIVHFPAPLLHPDGGPPPQPPGDTGNQREQPPGAPLTLLRVGTGLAMCGIHPSLTRALVAPQREVPGITGEEHGVTALQGVTTSRLALALGAELYLWIGWKKKAWSNVPQSPVRGSDTSQTCLWG